MSRGSFVSIILIKGDKILVRIYNAEIYCTADNRWLDLAKFNKWMQGMSINMNEAETVSLLKMKVEAPPEDPTESKE